MELNVIAMMLSIMEELLRLIKLIAIWHALETQPRTVALEIG
jgi:hypothetical protein